MPIPFLPIVTILTKRHQVCWFIQTTLCFRNDMVNFEIANRLGLFARLAPVLIPGKNLLTVSIDRTICRKREMVEHLSARFRRLGPVEFGWWIAIEKLLSPFIPIRLPYNKPHDKTGYKTVNPNPRLKDIGA